MKITRKILVCLLTLALSVSCFAFMASADTETVDYDDVLEYYEQTLSDAFDIDSLVTGTAYTDGVIKSSAASSYEEAVIGNDAVVGNYVDLMGAPVDKSYNYNLMLRWNAETGKLLNGVIMSFSINASGGDKVYWKCNKATCTHGKASSADGRMLDIDDPALLTTYAEGAACPSGNNGHVIKQYWPGDAIVHLVLSDDIDDSSVGDIHTVGSDLLTFDGAAGVLKYITVEGGETVYKTVDGFTFSTDKWYDVSIKYVAATKTYGFTVVNKADSTDKAVVENVPAPFETVGSVKLGTFGSVNGVKNSTVSTKIAALAIQGGTFLRDDDDKVTASENAVKLFAEKLEAGTESVENRIVMVETYARLVKVHGFTSENAEVLDALATLEKYVAIVFADKLVAYSESISNDWTYAERLAAFEANALYRISIPEDRPLLSPQENQAVEAAIALYEAEKLELDAIVNDSESFAEVFAGVDADSDDYTYLVAKRDLLLSYPKADATVSDDLKAVFEVYNAVLAKATAIETAGEDFIAKVNAATLDGADIEDRYAAFLEIVEFDNETYPGITAAIAKYEDVKVHFATAKKNSEDFIKLVADAQLASYINAKKTFVENAWALLAYSDDVEFFNADELAEAKLICAEIEASVNAQYAAANAYIEAVEALEALEEGADPTSLINAALALKERGNIAGVPGVNEANAILDSISAAVDLLKGYASKLHYILGGLSKAQTLLERYNIISEALTIDEDKLDMTSSTVSNDLDILDQAIEDYNADVAALNAEFDGIVTAVLQAQDVPAEAPVGKASDLLIAIIAKDAVA